MSEAPPDRPHAVRARSLAARVGRALWRTLLVALGLLALTLAVLFAKPLYHHLVMFPRETAELERLRAQAAPVQLDDGWTEHRAVVHAHSYLSHDSEIAFDDILAAARTAKVDVMFMTDHCINGRADFVTQWTGLHDGVRFVRGWELHNGLLIWGLPESATLNCDAPLADTAARVAAEGGLSAFGHTEMPRPYEVTDVGVMEIYNIHTDFLDEQLGWLLPELLANTGRWPDLAIRQVYDRPARILQLWDTQNRTRKMVGFGANDAHQNLGLRLVYTAQQRLWLRQSSRKSFTDPKIELNSTAHAVLEALFGPLTPGRELFHVDLDPYARSLRYVNTHLLAHDNSEAALTDALRNGRAFVAFNLLADARGFVLFAEADGARATMGEAIAFKPDLRLKGEAPLPARWTVLRDGEVLATQEGRRLDWPVPGPGNYRVELAVKPGAAWLDWIYANPVRVTAPAG